jgi:hypothetical protein
MEVFIRFMILNTNSINFSLKVLAIFSLSATFGLLSATFMIYQPIEGQWSDRP